MKKQFTKQEIIDNKGCFSLDQVEALSFINNSKISIIDILKSEITIKDKSWFLFKKCDLSLENKKELSLKLACIVLPIFESKYPDDKRVRECLEATEDFNNGKISKGELKIKQEATYSISWAAVYSATAAEAAYAAAYAAAIAAKAAYSEEAAAAAEAAYAAAAAAAYEILYSKQIENQLIEFINNN